MKSEPNWQDGCAGRGAKPGDECRDCIEQRKYYGYVLKGAAWVKEAQAS